MHSDCLTVNHPLREALHMFEIPLARAGGARFIVLYKENSFFNRDTCPATDLVLSLDWPMLP